MVKRAESLTQEQRDQMAPFAQEWIRKGLATGPVDWDAWEEGVRKCYEFACERG